ncbi:LysR family transcriptional regulator [Motilibacter rhizosphaerae]|uniref:LysR family transcriptional regulator n=1 Tax=Motilibacter rhizosphaerae TaxID=598652 RepID=UPI0013EECA98|nr:LysR family transcriptional regulator [Motilibacter rhizosphaerae]
MLDIRRLRVLKTVVDTGSVTAAAGVLSYTPSAVSQQLAVLEREAGTPLLERVGRGLRPTAAGLLLAEHAAALLERVAEAEAALAALREGRAGSLRVVAFQTAGVGLVPAVVGAFQRRSPDVRLDVTVADPPESIDAVRAGTADIALAVEPGYDLPSAEDAVLVRRHLLDDAYRVVLPRTHRLAGRRAVALEDLADDPWVMTSSCPGTCEAPMLEACAGAGFKPRVAVSAEDYFALQGYVEVGLGVALVPLLALRAVREGVVVRPVRGREPVRRVFAVTRRAIADDGAVRAFLQVAQEVATGAGVHPAALTA